MQNVSNLKFNTTTDELSPEDKKTMVDGMLAYHASKGHPRKVDHFSVMIKNQENQLVGVVMASFLWNGMEIDSLWVEKTYRGQGLGRQLMKMVEEEGTKRGCTVAYTNTFSWQAPDFYSKLGYTLFGKIEDFPKGCTLSYLSKRLS